MVGIKYKMKMVYGGTAHNKAVKVRRLTAAFTAKRYAKYNFKLF